MTAVERRPRYICARCGRDWTKDLTNIADAPGASLDALCPCDQVIAAAGARPGVLIVEGLVTEGTARRK